MGIKITGLDKFGKRLEKLTKNARALDGIHEITFDKLYTQKFMNEYTNFKTLNDLIEKSGFEVNSIEDLNCLSENEDFNKFISQNTQFLNFEEMHKASIAEYTKQALYDGI